jgi:hypothetical protein
VGYTTQQQQETQAKVVSLKFNAPSASVIGAFPSLSIRQAAAEAWPLCTKGNIDTGQPSIFQAATPQAAIDYYRKRMGDSSCIFSDISHVRDVMKFW